MLDCLLLASPEQVSLTVEHRGNIIAIVSKTKTNRKHK